MNLSELTELVENHYSPILTSGRSSRLSIDQIDECIREFSKKYFPVNKRQLFYCITNGIYKRPACPICDSREFDFSKRSTCSAKCRWELTSKITTEQWKEPGVHRKADFHKCPDCGQMTAKCKGFRCKPCGYKKRNQTLANRSPVDKASTAKKLSSAGRRRYANPEARDAHSRVMKDLIQSGKFTPKSSNRLIHKRLKRHGINFRSQFELDYYEQQLSMGYSLEYETVRIPYFDPVKKKTRIYIVDFYCPTRQLLIEVKPSTMTSGETETAKAAAAVKWAAKRGITYQYITELEIYG